MSEFDEQLRNIADVVRSDGKEAVGNALLLGRAEAEKRGRLLGEDEVRRRGLTGDDAASVIRAAVGYAVWDWEGRPINRPPKHVRQGEDWKPQRKNNKTTGE